MASSEAQQLFIDVFGDAMQKEGYIVKGNKFFKIDLQHKWIKVVFMGFWAQNRLYRICLDVIPLTSVFDLKIINEHVFFEINSLVRDFTKPSIPAIISFDAFYPTRENISKTFELYKTHIHSDLNSAATFDECIQYRSRLKKLAHLPEFEGLDMMYAYLYLDRIQDAYEQACLYKDSLCMQEKSMQETHAKELNAISSIPVREEITQQYEIQQRYLNEQMNRIDAILSSFQNHQLAPLIHEVGQRMDASINACRRFFTKAEQGLLGL